jgi:hypothetical protein
VRIYDGIPIIYDLKQLVQQFIDDGEDEIQYSQIYSWFDFALNGCMSPTDYPAIATRHAQGDFQFHFLWGCVENCSVLWSPSSSTSVDPSLPPQPPKWFVLECDNEGYIGYVGTPREAIVRLMKKMKEEVLRDGKVGDGLDAFVEAAVCALEVSPEEMDDSVDDRPVPPEVVEEIERLRSFAQMS